MATIRELPIVPLRFRTAEDGALFMECLTQKKKFPEDKWIYPYRVVDGVAVVNKEYADAPFELRYLYETSPR